MGFSLYSPAFGSGDSIPRRFARDGDNCSPPLAWQDPPPGTQSFILLVRDDGATQRPIHHWALYGLDVHDTQLFEGAGHRESTAGLQGLNDFGEIGYSGPQPPLGDGVHRYRFKLIALDRDRLEIPEQASAETIWNRAHRHAIGQADLVGTYER